MAYRALPGRVSVKQMAETEGTTVGIIVREARAGQRPFEWRAERTGDCPAHVYDAWLRNGRIDIDDYYFLGRDRQLSLAAEKRYQ